MATSDNKLKCGLLNIQSVGNKTMEIRSLINDEKFDILALTETWLGEYDKAKIKEMTPTTHTFVHIPRKEKKGGGVGLVLSKSCKKIKLENTDKYTSFEHMKVSFDLGPRKSVFIVVYRPPSQNFRIFMEEFRNFIETLDMVSVNTYICGDFNILIDNEENYTTRRFHDMMKSFNLVNKVESSTSVGGHILDLVFCDSDHNLVHEVIVDEICRISPVHKLVTFRIPCEKNVSYSKKIVFRKKNDLVPEILINNVVEKIDTMKNTDCSHNDQMNKCAACLAKLYNDEMRKEYEEMCPVKEKNIIVRDNAPWYNSEIHLAKKEKRQKEKKWRQLRTDIARREYMDKRNKFNKLILKRKRDYYRQKTVESKTNIGKLYKILDGLTGNKKANVLPEGYDDTVLANMFATFFQQKILSIVENFESKETNIQITMPMPQDKLLSFKKVSVDQTKTIVHKLNTTYCDSDPLPISDIIHSDKFSDILNVFTSIINNSFMNNTFPASEKVTLIKPIIKGKLDKQSLSSFRPVSNLTFLSKVIESAVLTQLIEHLQSVKALPDEQSAYRKLYSTETALCSVVNDLLILMDEGKCGLLILLDLSAAFDTVVHKLLLLDCKSVGIDGDAITFIESYLENRKYCVQVGRSFSDKKTLERGVPQGSVLGPVLFCIYTIELSYILRKYDVNFKLFADDTQFYMTLNNVDQVKGKIELIMDEVGKWMESKQLKLNQDKTECLLVGKNKDIKKLSMSTLCINGRNLDVCDAVKNLGVTLDSTLSMKEHIQQVVRTANYHLRNIGFIKKYLDETTMKMLVQNHVITKLDYCNSLYYGMPNYLLKELQLIMNRAARLIKGVPPRERITPVLIELHWLPIKARIEYKIDVMTHQALQSGKPEYLRKMLENFHHDNIMELRHDTDLHRLLEPRSNLEIGFRAFERCAPRLYNKLPTEIKDCTKMDTFKKQLKTYLFKESYDFNGMEIKKKYSC